MTWFAVPDDIAGRWAVANRQAPRSELEVQPRSLVGYEGGQPTYTQAPADVVICDGCKSQEDARFIAARMNYIDAWPPVDPGRQAEHLRFLVDNYSVPWPEAKEEA